MEILVKYDKTETLTYGTYRTIQLECGKRKAVVTIGPEDVSVMCQNAAHKAWNGAPKCYRNLEDAKANYKSASMKAMIEAVQEMLAVQPTELMH